MYVATKLEIACLILLLPLMVTPLAILLVGGATASPFSPRSSAPVGLRCSASVVLP
jgi:hypothetical protein